MRKAVFLRLGLLVVAALLLGSSAAQAQSAISGVIRDVTGAVLPGVTVEASSPALIEKVRSVISNDEGQYRVIDLRPGTYTVTFTLPGFSTVRREGITLEADFTANVNVELRVGSLEETITVSGETPVVDIQSTQRRQVMTKELLDALPAARNYATNTVAAVIRGVDVGGSSTMSHTTMNVYGSSDGQDIQVDGMSMKAAAGYPGVYYNYDANEEVVYQVAGGSAEATGGGVIVNMISRQGSNEFKGDSTLIYSDGNFQNSNYTDDLKARGLAAPSALDRVYDINVSVGGPIKRDKLWFFSSWRDWATDTLVANAFYPDGRQAVDAYHLFDFSNRVTYQLSNKNKITGLHDRMYKNQQSRGFCAGCSPEAAYISRTPIPVNNLVKWTSTASSRLLVEAAFSSQLFTLVGIYRPEVERPSATNPYGDIAKRDLIRSTTWNAYTGGEMYNISYIYRIGGSVSYVTGSHSFKVGQNWGHGYGGAGTSAQNGNLVQQYRSGVPDSVVVYNTPTNVMTNLDADLGIYAQDSWRINRLTLNPGLRFDLLRNSIPEQQAPAGRFVPERHFASIPKIINWTDWSPRLGAVYDLFGNGKTAIKGSVGKYVNLDHTVTAARFNPMTLSGGTSSTVTDTRRWTDTNRDDIAQESEIGPSANVNFGVMRSRNPADDLKRPYSWLTSIGVQQELARGMGLSLTYNRRDYRQLQWDDNLLTTHADYALLAIPDPRGNGQTLPLYNLNSAKLGLLDELVANTDLNRRNYEGLDVMLTARLERGTVTFGTSTGRIREVNCEVDDPNSLRFCDETNFDIPFRTNVRVVGTYQLPYGIRLSGVYQKAEQPTSVLATTYSVGRAIVPTLTQTSVSIALAEPGTQYYDMVHQVDFTVGRQFNTGRIVWQPRVEIANMLNANTVLNQVTTFGSALGRPNSILNGRVARIVVLTKF